jgi:hypothetical protein
LFADEAAAGGAFGGVAGRGVDAGFDAPLGVGDEGGLLGEPPDTRATLDLYVDCLMAIRRTQSIVPARRETGAIG